VVIPHTCDAALVNFRHFDANSNFVRITARIVTTLDPVVTFASATRPTCTSCVSSATRRPSTHRVYAIGVLIDTWYQSDDIQRNADARIAITPATAPVRSFQCLDMIYAYIAFIKIVSASARHSSARSVIVLMLIFDVPTATTSGTARYFVSAAIG
jgi:hypothetical protein